MKRACMGLLIGMAAVADAAAPEGLLSDARWEEGKASFEVLAARIERYGVPREGSVKLILVKEPFDPLRLVKTAGAGATSVLKMNYTQHVPTGIYDYHQMASLYFDRGSGELLKFVMTSQDGCGQTVMTYAAPRGGRPSLTWASYFDDEGAVSVDLPAEPFVFYDALPLLLRLRLDGPQTYPLRIADTLIGNRVQPLRVGEATVRVERVSDVPGAGGSLGPGWRATVSRAAGRDALYFGEAFPHVLLGWARADGDELWLAKSHYIHYWKYTNPESSSLVALP